MDALQQAAGRVHEFVSSLQVDDSNVPYFKLTVGFVVLEYAFHTYLDLRQRRAVKTGSPPAELADHYSKEHVDKTRAYSVDKKDFALVKGAFDVAESLATLLLFLMPWAWRVSERAVAHIQPRWAENEYAVSVAFMLLTSGFDTVKSLPWSLYSTFVIEQRHGFNKQTLALFFADLGKTLAIGLVVIPPILCAVLYILKVASPYMPLYLWGFFLTLQVALMYVYPTLIQPLFNKYAPLQDGTLRERIQELADSLAYPLKKLFVVDGSKRSGHSNAYMFGFGKNKRIVLFDTLIDQCTEQQVVAVLAHELGHWKLGHTVCLLVGQSGIMLAQLMLFALFRSSETLLRDFGFTEARPVIISLSLFMMILGPAQSLIGFCFNLLSRRFEYQADRFAVDQNHAQPLSEALKVLDKENKSDFVVDKLYSTYHYSHPSLAERLRAISLAAKKML